MNKYYRVVVTGKAVDLNRLMIDAVENYDCQGVEEFSLEECKVDEILGERAYSGGDIPDSVIDEVESISLSEDENSFNFYFYEENSEERATRFYGYVKTIPNICGNLITEEIRDWNSEWRKHFSPLKISDKLKVVPEWMKEAQGNNSEIYIYPGMGFGTGNHETTFICLSVLEKLIEIGARVDRVLDFGCGSGILGIAAIRRTNAAVDFCDIDRNALNNTLQNLKLNFDIDKLYDTRLVIRDRFEINGEYDLVFANILSHILIEEYDTITVGLKIGGYLVLSGILNEQTSEVIRKFGQTLVVEEILSKGDWSGILLKRVK